MNINTYSSLKWVRKQYYFCDIVAIVTNNIHKVSLVGIKDYWQEFRSLDVRKQVIVLIK
jgi:hypothetical protein